MSAYGQPTQLIFGKGKIRLISFPETKMKCVGCL